MMRMLEELASSLDNLKCQQHACKIKFVVTGKNAATRFMCTECVESMGPQASTMKGMMQLREYLSNIKELITKETIKEHPVESLLTETDKALEVTSKLTEDLTQSLADIKDSLQDYYDDMLVKVTRNASKCIKLTTNKIDTTLKKNLLELSGIEKNLKIMKDGGSPADAQEIIDMALEYTTKKCVADNALYDLLNGLNPLESAQSTHRRLTEFSKKYMRRKRAIVLATRAILAKRFRQDEELVRHIFSMRSKVLRNMDQFLVSISDQLRKGNQSRKDKRDKTRKMSKAGHRTGRGDTREKSTNNREYLGKRKPKTSTYDPKRSFETFFGYENDDEKVDRQYNVHGVIGAVPAHNRLAEVLNVRRTQMSRFQPNQRRYGNGSSDKRSISRTGFNHYRDNRAFNVQRGSSLTNNIQQQQSSNVLGPRNPNVANQDAQNAFHTEKTTKTDSPENITLSARKTSISYENYMAKQNQASQNSKTQKQVTAAGDRLKENMPVRTKADLLEGIKGFLEEAILGVPIKKLNVNDPRRRLIAEQDMTNSTATNDN